MLTVISSLRPKYCPSVTAHEVNSAFIYQWLHYLNNEFIIWFVFSVKSVKVCENSNILYLKYVFLISCLPIWYSEDNLCKSNHCPNGWSHTLYCVNNCICPLLFLLKILFQLASPLSSRKLYHSFVIPNEPTGTRTKKIRKTSLAFIILS